METKRVVKRRQTLQPKPDGTTARVGVAPVFEGYVNPYTAAGEIQGFANIAAAANDKKYTANRRIALGMAAIFVLPLVGSLVLLITNLLGL